MPTPESALEILNSIYPFRTMDDESVQVVAEHMAAMTFEAGDVIYTEGDEAHHLFIVHSGMVRMTLPAELEEEVLGTYRQGDFFGFEVLEERGLRRTTATAMTHVELLVFDEPSLVFLSENVPDVSEALDLMLASFDMIMRLRFSWLGENEVVYYLARRHPAFLVIRLIPIVLGVVFLAVLLSWFLSTPQAGFLAPLIAFGLLFLVAVVASAWVFIDWANDYSIITSQRVAFQERIVLLYDSRREAPLNAILAVTTETTLLGRLLNYGNVIVRTFTGMIVLPSVRAPDEVARVVEADWYRARINLTRAERAAVEYRIREIIGAPTEGPAPVPVPAGVPLPQGDEEQVEPTWFQRIFADLFQLRYEKDGVIIYRKHWWILLRHIALPSAAVFALAALAVYGTLPAAIIPASTALLLALLLSPFALGWWLYSYIDWRNDYFMVTDEQVLDVYRKPLAREERRAAPLRNIQSIEFERLGVIGLLLNFGTVYIRVGDTQLTFDEVYNPSEVQRELFNRLAQREYRERLAEQKREHDRMSQWLSTYHRLTSGDPNQTPAPDSDQF